MANKDEPFLPGLSPPPPGNAATPHGRHRFYFAVRPDGGACDAAIAISDRLHRAGSAVVKRENLHVSLIPIWRGDFVPPGIEADAGARAQEIEAAPFVLTFDKVESFRSGQRWCVVLTASRGIAGLYGLQRKLIQRFSGKDRMGSFMPHMTLLYARTCIDKQPVAPLSWAVREFVLLHSYYGTGRQEIVARRALR